jgi:hypothetical protein
MINWERTLEKFIDFDINKFRPKVVVNCDKCGKESIITIRVKSKIINNQMEWLCQKCVALNNRNKFVDSTKRAWKDKNYRKIITESSKKLWKNKNYINKIKHDEIKFIEKAKFIHGDLYDYSKTDYINSNTKVKIICPKHGEFEQLPLNHLKGHGCFNCCKMSNNEFVEKAKSVHGDLYDYSKTDYINSNVRTKIICSKHGEFSQLPLSHLNGNGCPKCSAIISKGHKEIIDFIDRKNAIINCKNVIGPYEIDIFIPKLNIGVEYNGLYYHSFNSIESKDQKFYHYNKTFFAINKGIQLLQVFEDEWIYKKDIVKSIINSKLNKNNKIYARNCSVVDVNSKEFFDFCDLNHIQGSLNSRIKLGLIYNNELICVMGFNVHNKYCYECTRFCNKLNFNVIGGASKLFKHFVKRFNPESVLTYADRRYSNGNLYVKLGFDLVGITNPGYFYVKGNKKYSRNKFQKHKLEKVLSKYNKNNSEAINMFNNGYRRLWDSGHYKFVWHNFR